MTGLGVLLLCASWINLTIMLNESIVKAILEGAGIQFSLTIASIVVYSVTSVIPYFGNVVIVGLALLGSYYFPQMTVTFMCTALGTCFISFSVSKPDKKE